MIHSRELNSREEYGACDDPLPSGEQAPHQKGEQKMTEIKSTTFPIVLAGEEYAIRFDLDAQIGVVTTSKIMNPGIQDIKWWRFLDAPYDVPDMVIMIMHGINGARRFNGEKKFLKIDDAKELLEKHFDYLYERASEIEDDEAAMKFVQDETKKLFESLQDAARGGSGFRKRRSTAESA